MSNSKWVGELDELPGTIVLFWSHTLHTLFYSSQVLLLSPFGESWGGHVPHTHNPELLMFIQDNTDKPPFFLATSFINVVHDFSSAHGQSFVKYATV